MKYFIFSIYFFTSVFSMAQSDENIESKIALEFTKCELLSSSDKSFLYKKQCIQDFYDNHSFAKTTYQLWSDTIKKDISDRLVEADEETLQYMTLDGLLWGFPYENIKSAVDPELVKGAVKALKELPPELQKYIGERFYGFMIVSGVGWTGWAAELKEQPGNPLKSGSVIIINADNIVGKNLNEWLVFKEKTAFSAFNNTATKYPQYDLKMYFSKPGVASSTQDNLKQFLIHEIAHLVAVAVPSIHPSFPKRNKPVPVSEFLTVWEDGSSGFPFLSTTWNPVLSDTKPGEPQTYVMRRQVSTTLNTIFDAKPVRYYGEDDAKKFNIEEAIKIYQQLDSSCFPSLYATVDYTEDFAETVTHYFMTYKDNYSFKVDVTKKKNSAATEKVIASFESPVWKSPKCAYKLEFMKALFQ